MQYAKQARFSVAEIAPSGTQTILSEKLSDLSPVLLSRVKNYAERQFWYEYMDHDITTEDIDYPFSHSCTISINPE